MARGCPRHAVAALDGIAGAYVDWADSKGLNEWERRALVLSEKRSRLLPRGEKDQGGIVAPIWEAMP